MFDLSKEEIIQAIENCNKIINRIEEIAKEIGFLNKEFKNLSSTEITENFIYITASNNYGNSTTTSGFPIDFLFDDEGQHKDWFKNQTNSSPELEDTSNSLDSSQL
jgi:hypothetical protein